MRLSVGIVSALVGSAAAQRDAEGCAQSCAASTGCNVLTEVDLCIARTCPGVIGALLRVGVICSSIISENLESLRTTSPTGGSAGATTTQQEVDASSTSTRGGKGDNEGDDTADSGGDAGSNTDRDSDAADRASAENSSATSSGASGSLSTGAKAGIAVGSIAGVALLLGLLYFVWRHGKSKGAKEVQSMGTTSTPLSTNQVASPLQSAYQHLPQPPAAEHVVPTGGMQVNEMSQKKPFQHTASELSNTPRSQTQIYMQPQALPPELGGRQSPGLQEVHGDPASYELGTQQQPLPVHELPGTQ